MSNINYIATVLVFSLGLMCQAIGNELPQNEPILSYELMSRDVYEQHYRTLNTDFQMSMQHCATTKYDLNKRNWTQSKVSNNNNMIKNKAQCQAHALANKSMKIADLRALYSPTIENRYRANLLKAELNLKLTNDQCDKLKFVQENKCTYAAKNHYTEEAAKATAQRNIEMNQALLKSKSLKLDRFNSSIGLFLHTDLRKPTKYKT